MIERIKKLNEVLKRELGKIILKEVDLPKNILLTLTKIETSKDLGQSKVFISVLPEKETSNALRILNREAYNFHQILNKIMFIRKVPKIRFFEDKQLKEAQKIDKILDRIREES